MVHDPPFIDPESGGLDYGQIKAESYRIVGLVALFVGLAFVPLAFALVFGSIAGVGFLFFVVAQLILVVGGVIVLIYAVARGIQLADA